MTMMSLAVVLPGASNKKCSKCNEVKELELFRTTNKISERKDSWCCDCRKIEKRKWYIENRFSENNKSKQWSKDHMAEICSKIKKRRNSDPIFKLTLNMRCRLKLALRRQRAGKNVKSSDGIGCTWLELKKHLEQQFQPGMTWENWGKYGWHVDHIKPIDSFDLSDPEQVLIAFNYTNLQPLWAKDNLSKGSKV